MKKHFLIMAMAVINSVNLLFSANSNPTMSRVYANQYTPGIADTQQAGQIGYLVPTGVFGTNGSVGLAGQSPDSKAVALQILDNGIMAVLFDDGVNSYIVQYTAQGAVYTGFAAGTGNKVTISGLTNTALSMSIDPQGRFLISGSNDTNSLPWIRRITADGLIDGDFVFTDGASWTTTGQINQLCTQVSGRILAVGFNGTNAMIARYNLNGAIDPTFGAGGYIILDGVTTSGSRILPLSTAALQNVVVDAQNNTYIAYATTTPLINVIRLTTSGLLDVSWNAGNPVQMSYLTGSGMILSSLRMVLNLLGDIVIAVASQTPTVIKAASITSATGSAGSFANFTTSGGIFGSNNYALSNMIATSDGSVYFIGSDVTTLQMMIVRCTSSGSLDQNFNNATGVNFFNIASGSLIDSYMQSAAIAPDGQIYTVGYQTTGGPTTITPYISSLYNNQYVYQIAQSPETREQGILDTSFGPTSTETNLGVVSPYIGLYRTSLQQKAEAITELESGNILIGMNGFTDSQSYTSMMLVRLTQAGLLDMTFGTGGKLVIPNITTGVSEFITGIVEDSAANLYVSGYSSAGALFRKYDAAGTLIWNADYNHVGYQGLGVGFISTTRALLFLSGPASTGQINAYEALDGTVDTAFNGAGTVPGSILTTDLSLNMGPVSNSVISDSQNLFIAYKSTSTSQINVVNIVSSGSTTVWTASNVFSAYSSIAADDIRVSFNKDGNLVVVASYGPNFLMTLLNKTTGAILTPVSVIPCGTSMHVEEVIGISNGDIVIAGYDGATDGAMVVARISSNGVIDITFDSQGQNPGVASLKIGDQIADFYARVASGITLQSHTGLNQGNLIVAGYEQMFSTSSIPMVLRLFGMPGTTQVPSFPRVPILPGDFDTAYGSGGIAQTYALGATTPVANQEVRSIRELTGTQIMTVITDNTTSISYTERLNANGSIDTTYGNGLGIAIAKLPGVESVNHMVFDGVGNMLVVGSNATYGGYVKRILSNITSSSMLAHGTMNPLFGGPTGQGGLSDSVPYPVGTAYGLMTSVHACQQLTDGNIVIVGNNEGVGSVQIVGSTGLSSTILSSGIPFGTNGQYIQGVNATSVSVDPSNNMYVAIAYLASDATTKKAGILKLKYPSGTPDTSFGVDGFVDSALEEIDSYDSVRLAFDSQGNIVIAGSFGESSGRVAVNRFTSTGVQDSTFNGGTQLNIGLSISTNVIVTGLSILEDNKILIAGYQSDSSPSRNFDFIACVADTGILDASFGSGNIPGLVTFQAPDGNIAQSARRLIDLNVQTDGNILLCGGDIPVTPLHQETPLTFRLYGFPHVQEVPQFTGEQIVLPSPLNPAFNPTGTPPGISATGVIPDLSELGNIAVDSSGFTLISGITSTGLFTVVRYVRNGSLDPEFGNNGIATSATPIAGLSGGYIIVDGLNRLYVGGISTTNQFIVARLTSNGQFDPSFGTGGVAVSASVTNLSGGGFIGFDRNNKPVVGGFTSDDFLVAARFTEDGDPDTTFAGGAYAAIFVNALISGGSILTDAQNSMYVGGMTSTSEMVVVKFDNTGTSVPFSTVSGVTIATTGMITGLVAGGAIALDNSTNVVIGGLTSNQTFVTARFLATGLLDPIFNESGAVPGVAYSTSIAGLGSFGNINVDSNNNIIVGGTAMLYDGSMSMVISRFTSVGNLDTILSAIGIASTGSIPHLVRGGVVATDMYDNIFIGGLTDLPGFVVAQMYSGEEIFVLNTTELSPADLKTFYYATNRDYFTDAIAAPFYAQAITNPAAAQVVLTEVLANLNLFFDLYVNQPGWNPLWHAYRTITQLDKTRIALHIIYPNLTIEIDTFFALLTARITSLKYRLVFSLA